MNSKDRDMYIFKKIIKYCFEADATIQLFGDNVETLRTNVIYKNATAMCVLQIGELVRYLSEDIVGKYSAIPWKQVKAMRNIAAHGYEEFDIDVLWQTLKSDLPNLREYCEGIISIEST